MEASAFPALNVSHLRRIIRKPLHFFTRCYKQYAANRNRFPASQTIPSPDFQRSIMPFSISPAHIWPVLMLVASNVFMTFAWYGHLKHKGSALFMAILASWGIAFFEYCLAVPANRMGSEVYSTAQLKTIQEVITLAVFALFSVFWLKESITINHLIGFALIALGASFIFRS